MESEWIFVTPGRGLPGFEVLMIMGLINGGPAHIWMSRPGVGFAMRSTDFKMWMEVGGGPYEAASPRLITITTLECGEALEQAIAKLHAEVQPPASSGWTMVGSDNPAEMNRVLNDIFGPR